jgi:hypothetical protein
MQECTCFILSIKATSIDKLIEAVDYVSEIKEKEK